jgi:UPF0176 protein
MTYQSSDDNAFLVLLYYQFVPIEDPESFAADHLSFCRGLGLRGRILVSPEGLNGTVSGPREACQTYMDTLRGDPRFAEMTFKVDRVQDHVFRKMFVRVKKELVTFRADVDSDPLHGTGTYLEPQQWMEMLGRDDVIVVDGRTGYEYDLGHFRGALRPDTDSFKEFPEWIEKHLGENRDAPILTYCTGGIRCEKLTAYMKNVGFSNVYQLHGGIVSYGKDEVTKGALWDGLCYVFDERIAVPINTTEDRRIVGSCYHCGTPTERYVNCANVECNLQHLCCEECERRTFRSCSDPCREAPRHDVLRPEWRAARSVATSRRKTL